MVFNFNIAVNLYMLGYGIFNGWNEREYDYHFERLRLDENFNWNEYESSSFRQLFIWFIGPFVGSIFFGVISMKFGKKVSLLYMPIPMIVSFNESPQKNDCSSYHC